MKLMKETLVTKGYMRAGNDKGAGDRVERKRGQRGQITYRFKNRSNVWGTFGVRGAGGWQ